MDFWGLVSLGEEVMYAFKDKYDVGFRHGDKNKGDWRKKTFNPHHAAVSGGIVGGILGAPAGPGGVMLGAGVGAGAAHLHTKAHNKRVKEHRREVEKAFERGERGKKSKRRKRGRR
jgi:hypothetical protein